MNVNIKVKSFIEREITLDDIHSGPQGGAYLFADYDIFSQEEKIPANANKHTSNSNSQLAM